MVALLFDQQSHARRHEARATRRFVDTASQTVVNMFSYTQNNIDDSVNRFVDGTSGPLRDMMSQGNNVENLKAIFRDTNASSEAVINGAALEKIDETADNAAVLVAVRVTVTDLDGVNAPSQAVPAAGDRARGRQRPHDGLRPEVSRRGQLMGRLASRLAGARRRACSRSGFVALAGFGGSLYWNRVERERRTGDPGRAAPAGRRSRSRSSSATTTRRSSAAAADAYGC